MSGSRMEKKSLKAEIGASAFDWRRE